MLRVCPELELEALVEFCSFSRAYIQMNYEKATILQILILDVMALGDAQFLEDESTKIFAKTVADHYSARINQTLEEREASPIIHLKKLNNWVCPCN